MDRNKLQPKGLLDNLLGMPQSLSFNLIHLIFSTKNRTPAITQDIIDDLHAYLSQVARKHDSDLRPLQERKPLQQLLTVSLQKEDQKQKRFFPPFYDSFSPSRNFLFCMSDYRL